MNALHVFSVRVYRIWGKGWMAHEWLGMEVTTSEVGRKLRGLNMLKSVYRGKKKSPRIVEKLARSISQDRNKCIQLG